MYKEFIFILLLICLPTCYGNEDTHPYEDLVQLSGRMHSYSGASLPFAHILILNNYRGTITDNSGKYSIVAQVGDTIIFSSLGYKPRQLVIPDTLKHNFYYADLQLERDTFMIGEVEIYPWKSYEEFKKAFLELELPNDDMANARKNIALIQTQIILDRTPSARANFQKILNEQYRQTFTQGQFPSYQIFNPFAWAKFFEALKRGDFKKYEQSNGL